YFAKHQLIFIGESAGEKVAKKTREGHDTESADLDEQHDDALSEYGKVGGNIGDGEPGNAYGAGSHKQGVYETQRREERGARQHQQHRSQKDEREETDDKQDRGVEIEVIEKKAVPG